MNHPGQDRFAQSGHDITIDSSARRPTGQEIFDSMTPAEQDAALGPKAAEAVRSGRIKLSELARITKPAGTRGFLIQKPDEDLDI